MLFSVDDKHLIKVLRGEKHYTARDFLRQFPNKKWFWGGLYPALSVDFIWFSDEKL